MDNNKLKKFFNEKIILFVIVFVHIIALFCLSNFSKRLETYPDELIYTEIARNIAERHYFEVHSVPFDFTNILYSIVISPAFVISDTFFRVKIITLINSFVISFAIIPVYLICKELRLKAKYTWMTVAIIFVWPDMLNSVSFMSENIYFPIGMFALLFCIRMFNRRDCYSSLLAGLFSYLAYFSKEVGLCIPVACIVAELLFIFFENGITTNNLRNQIKRSRFKPLVLYCLSFAFLYLFFKMVLLANVQNLYAKGGSLNFALLKDPYWFLYFLYAIKYYIVACIIALMVFPVAIPLLQYNAMKQILKKTYIFAILLLAGTIVVIALTISIREDLGLMVPRVHLRYLCPLIGIFLPLLYASIDVKDPFIQKEKQNGYIFWIGLCLVGLFTFKGVKRGCVTESMSLNYTKLFEKIIPNLMASGDGGIQFYVASWLIIVIIFFASWYIINQLMRQKHERAIYTFTGIALFVCIINCVCSYWLLLKSYKVDPAIVAEMDSINDYFIDNNLDSANVMYVAAKWTAADAIWYSADAKVYDLYFDAANDEMEITSDYLKDLLYNKDEYSSQLCKDTFHDTIYYTPYVVDTIDYFIVGDAYKDFDKTISGIELIDSIGGNEFFVYKNIDHNTMDVNCDSGPINISYTSENNNAILYTQYGISGCEGEFSWTDGKELLIEVDGVKGNTAKVTFDILRTYNGVQNYIVLQNNTIIDQGEVNGESNISFNAMVEDNKCTFKVMLPNAISPKENEGSPDERVLSLALRSISIEPG